MSYEAQWGRKHQSHKALDSNPQTLLACTMMGWEVHPFWSSGKTKSHKAHLRELLPRAIQCHYYQALSNHIGGCSLQSHTSDEKLYFNCAKLPFPFPLSWQPPFCFLLMGFIVDPLCRVESYSIGPCKTGLFYLAQSPQGPCMLECIKISFFFKGWLILHCVHLLIFQSIGTCVLRYFSYYK
jgi:hypothetical protein